MGKSDAPRRFTSEQAWNRYRTVYEEDGKTSDTFFPRVGIKPMTDGGLFAAGYFLCQRLGLPTSSDPRSFLELIAVTNWCKFTIESPGNVDYLGDTKKLAHSLPFVVGELAELRPSAVLVPGRIWKNQSIQGAMRGASPWSQFLPAPQFNATVVNTHLDATSFARKASVLRKRMTGTPLDDWMRNLRSINTRNAWRYLAFLGNLLDSRGRQAFIQTCPPGPS